MKLIVGGVGALVVLSLCNVGCSGGTSQKTGVVDGQPNSMGSAAGTGQGGAGGATATVSDASGSPRLCSDLFDQTVVPSYSIEISSDNWAKLDADFHDLKDVLAGTPPQTYYPIVFHYGSETVSNAGIRLRGKSSWVSTVMFDANPKMQFDVSFDQTRHEAEIPRRLDDSLDDAPGRLDLHQRSHRQQLVARDRPHRALRQQREAHHQRGLLRSLHLRGERRDRALEGVLSRQLQRRSLQGRDRGGDQHHDDELAAAAAAPRGHRHRDAAGPGRPAEHRARVGRRGRRQRRRRVLRRLAQLLHLRPGDARLALDSRPHRLGPRMARAVRPLGVVQGTSHLLVGRSHRAGRAGRRTI